MHLVVADTGPIRCLVEIGHIGILPRLFERIFIPSLVYGELVDAKSIKEGKFEAIAGRAKQYPALVAKARAEMGA